MAADILQPPEFDKHLTIDLSFSASHYNTIYLPTIQLQLEIPDKFSSKHHNAGCTRGMEHCNTD